MICVTLLMQIKWSTNIHGESSGYDNILGSQCVCYEPWSRPRHRSISCSGLCVNRENSHSSQEILSDRSIILKLCYQSQSLLIYLVPLKRRISTKWKTKAVFHNLLDLTRDGPSEHRSNIVILIFSIEWLASGCYPGRFAAQWRTTVNWHDNRPTL